MQVIVNNINEIIRKEFSPMEMNPSKIDFPLYETDIDTLNDFLRSTAIYDTFDMNDSKFEILYNLAIDLRYVETKSKKDQFLNYIIPFYIGKRTIPSSSHSSDETIFITAFHPKTPWIECS